MNRKIIRVIIPILILVELSFIFLTFMSYQNKVVESKETSKVDREKFAMYRENMDGEYEEITSTNGMTDRYAINQSKTVCTDNNKEEVKDIITFSNSKITVKTNKTVFCYLYFDMLKDLTINVSTDGEDGTVPTTLGYNKTISCNNGSTPTWNYKYNRLEFSNVLGEEEVCNLTYTKDTNTYQTLRDTVENDDEIVHETADVLADLDSYVPLEESEYREDYKNNQQLFSNISYDETNKRWVGISTKESTSSHMFMYIKETAFYKLCYEVPASNSSYTTTSHSYNNYIYYYDLNGNRKNVYSNLNGGSSKSECVNFGYLYKGQTIDIYGIYYDANSSFWLTKNNNFVNEISGYRYEGTNPNNYVWFNNEMWRIIGSIPTKVSEDGTEENLVKIIRNNALNALEHTSNRLWGNNEIYTILNEYYYGKKNINDINVCFTSAYGKGDMNAKCNYEVNGINPNDYYGKMVKRVYWNTGIGDSDSMPDTRYSIERTIQTIQGNIGIMSTSDYLYASGASRYENIDDYSNLDQTKNNWLFKYNQEWILAYEIFKTETLWQISESGFAGVPSLSYSGIVRPVLYLDSLVYVVDGDGTEANPYQIAMD